MPSRNELNARARAAGFDPATIPNDSKLEQKVLWLEKRSSPTTGTLAIATLTSDATAPSDGETVTIGSLSGNTGLGKTYTFKTTLTGVFATVTLTSDATAPADGDIVQIGGQAYTYRTALTTVPTTIPNEVLIGVSAAVALDNLQSAVNGSAGSGTTYSTGTSTNTQVQATTNTNTTQLFQALVLGTYGNSITCTETSGHLSFGATSMSGGVAGVENEVLIGGSAAIALDNIKLAVNGTATTAGAEEYSVLTTVNKDVTATTNTNTTQLFQARETNVGDDFTSTETSAHLSFAGTTFHAGTAGVAGVVAVAGAGTRDTNAGLSGDKNTSV